MRWSAVLFALLLVNCANPAPARAPDITGQITRAIDGPGRVTLIVETVPSAASGSPKAQVTVDASTRIFHANANVSAQLQDLLVGATVSVWFNGPVAESYPLQAKAGTLLIQTDAGSSPLRVPAPSRAPRP
jgi:beta-N-acetylhexosaminidase